jgi:hypothetical protein
VKWWALHVGTRMPSTAAEAVERLRAGEMPRVLEIKTRPDGEYTRVVRLRQEAGRQPGDDGDDEAQAPAAAPADVWGDEELPF